MAESGIFKQEPFYKKPRFWRWAVLVGLFLLVLIAFRSEIRDVWNFLRRVEVAPPLAEAERSLVILIFNFFAFLFFFFVSLLLVSQFVLPVHTLDDRLKVFSRLYLHLAGRHGPAIKVREAKLVATEEELRSSRPGVAFVDLCSAIALERRWVPVGGASIGAAKPRRRLSTRQLLRFLRFRRQEDRGEVVRVAGPGIVFTEWGERIRGVADLRRQFRLTPNIIATTRDGFQIRTHVWVMFTLGEPAEVFKVAYVGDRPEDLRAIRIEEKRQNGRITSVIRLVDEFDALDKAEIHHFASNYRPPLQAVVPTLPQQEWRRPPYVFDGNRVFAAVYAQAQTNQPGVQEAWADLPGKVAIEVLRDRLSLANLDDLLRPGVAYDPADPSTTFPVGPFRESFSRAVRNLGVLSFQFVRRKDGRFPENGMEWNEQDWEIFPAQPLRTPKVLRDRGIRVIAAGFPEIHPTHPGVREGWTQYWKAGWEQQEKVTEAEHALQAMYLRTKVRSQTQREMYATLSQIFSQPDMSREALALRVFQALEDMAADPATRRLLPDETLSFLWDLRQYLKL